MILRPPRSTQSRSSAASDVYKRQPLTGRLRAITLAHRRVRHPRKPPDGPNVADITPGSIHSGVTFAARRADNGPTANGAPAPPWTRAPAHRLWGRREARLLVLGRDEAAHSSTDCSLQCRTSTRRRRTSGSRLSTAWWTNVASPVRATSCLLYTSPSPRD